jgi:hypothetical protein
LGHLGEAAMPAMHFVNPGGSRLWLPVLLSLHNISGGCGSDGASSRDDAARYAYSYMEKSGCFIPFGVASSLCDLGSPAVLVESDPVSLDDDMAGGHHSLLGHLVLHVYIGEFGVPIVAALKLYVASLEAFSLRWEPASSCKLGVSLFRGRRFEWWLRLSATKTTGRPFQGLGCNFLFYQCCLCKGVCVIHVMNK